MAVIQDININVYAQPSEKRLRTFLTLSQNENGRLINFRILGAPLPSNCVATFSGTKPDGNVYSTTGTVTGNFVVVAEDMQMTAVAGVWDAKLDIINGTHNIMTALIRVVVDADVVDSDAIASDSQLQGLVAEAKYYAEEARIESFGAPLTAALKADMLDKTRVYVYTGSETGMTAGHWYYWNGSAWTDGGVYNAAALDTDKTLSVPDKAADGKATGDALALKVDKVTGKGLSTNDYTTAEKDKLSGIAEGATKVEIDSALSTAGKAADAKETGDRIGELKSEITDKSDTADMLKAFPTDTASGSVASFADGANVPVKRLIVNIDPVQSGSGDPSPTNVRPISGWSEVNVQRTGKNLLALPVVRFSEVDATIANCFFIKAGTYCVSFDVSETNRIGIRLLDLNGNVYSDNEHKPVDGWAYNSTTKSYYQGADSSQTHREIALTIVQDCYVRIVSNLTGGGLTNAQLELGSTATPYEPYSGQSINIALGQTVYGGTLDVLSGELVIDRYYTDGINWTQYAQSNGYTAYKSQNLPLAKSNNDSMNLPISNAVGEFGSFSSASMNKTIMQPPRASSEAAYLAYPDGADPTGVTLSYLIKDPVTIQLTPHEVTALLGSNNIWADSGDSEVVYRADPTLYIQRLTEPDADMVADSNITSGQYFMVGNTLYKATANIASGGAITPNVNCTRKSLSEALNELNA